MSRLLKCKETGKVVRVIGIKDGWVFYEGGETRLDYLHEFYEELPDDQPVRVG